MDVQELQGAVTTFRRSVGQQLRHVESEVGEVQAKAQGFERQLTAQEEKLQAQDARLDSVVSDVQAQFLQAQGHLAVRLVE